MFDSIRDKFYTFQENLSTSLRGLSGNDSVIRRPPINENSSLNLNAGTDVLDRFQTTWSQLHEASQGNANKAQEVGDIICKLHKNTEEKCRAVNKMASILTSLPEVVHSLNELCDKVITLEELFDSVEKALIQLEDLIDIRELQNKQLEHRFQLALHNEKKLAMLENVRLKLAEEFAEKVRKHEVRQQRLLKECQEASEENFKQDLKIYKETKTVPKIEFAKSRGTHSKATEETLEDIILDKDNSDVLDEFLNDSDDGDVKNTF